MDGCGHGLGFGGQAIWVLIMGRFSFLLLVGKGNLSLYFSRFVC